MEKAIKISAELIDLEIIESRRALDQGLLPTIIQMYKEDAPEIIEKLDILQKQNKLSGLTDSAHKLKGMSANVGAKAVQQVSLQIEHLCRQNKTEELLELIQLLRKTYQETIIRLEKLI